MTQRFFCNGEISLGELTLKDAEARHLAAVMRAKPGDRIALFNGQGGEFEAVVETVNKRSVVTQVVAHHTVERELPFELTLCVAAPKGDRCKWLVEKATEVGVSRLIFLNTERSVASPNEKSIERLQRTVIETSKQCGRNRLMAIEPATSITAAISQSADVQRKFFGHLQGKQPLKSIEPFQQAWIAIGPEGGWSNAEIEQLERANWIGTKLGASVLRIETAAISLAAILSAAQ